MTTRTKSVSKARQDRVPFDAYQTPVALALTICNWLKQFGVDPAHILEPSAGHGSFVKAARAVWPKSFIVANEIQTKLVEPAVMREYLLACAAAKAAAKAKKVAVQPPEPPVPTLDTREVLVAAGANDVVLSDFTSTSTGTFLLSRTPEGFGLVIGNPPYSLGGGAAAHTEQGIELLTHGGVLAYLMKMHFRGTEARISFWHKRRDWFACDPPIVPRPDFTGDGRDTSEYTLFCWHRPIENSQWRIHCASEIKWNGETHG